MSTEIPDSWKSIMLPANNILIAKYTLVVVVVFVFAMLLVAGVLKLITEITAQINPQHRNSSESLVPILDSSSQEENPYIQRNLVSEVKVPLIYTEDNELLKKNIYSLRDQLVSRGVDAMPIDEFTFPEVNSNWIDFGEKVAKTHSMFVFIVSPLLYRLCHEGKYGDKNMFASLAEKTKGQHIPMVVLRTLDILYFKHLWKPRIFLVELKDDLDTVSQEDFAAGLNLSSDMTLSHRLAADHFILYEAQIFNISVKEFQDSIACESREVIRLTRCLNPQRE